jgi:hypothetical protein
MRALDSNGVQCASDHDVKQLVDWVMTGWYSKMIENPVQQLRAFGIRQYVDAVSKQQPGIMAAAGGLELLQQWQH